jgi:hypothetical protein
MDSNRSRAATLIGVAAAAGAFGFAGLMSAATAPTARADDFTDLMNAVDYSFADGQADFTSAFSDFGSGDVTDGLGYFLSGVDSDFVAAPDALYVGSFELLTTDQTVTTFFDYGVPPESDFTSASSDAEDYFASSQSTLAEAWTDLSSGDYADGVSLDALGSFEGIAGVQVLLEGAVASF